VFRAPGRRPPAVLSVTFAALALAPLALLAVMLRSLGVNLRVRTTCVEQSLSTPFPWGGSPMQAKVIGIQVPGAAAALARRLAPAGLERPSAAARAAQHRLVLMAESRARRAPRGWAPARLHHDVCLTGHG